MADRAICIVRASRADSDCDTRLVSRLHTVEVVVRGETKQGPVSQTDLRSQAVLS
jgi:hypothetical protein